MDIMEALARPRFDPEIDRSFRYCGLIDAKYMHLFEIPSQELEDILKFDKLCDDSNGGCIMLGNKYFRVDRYWENGNTVRSVIDATVHADGSATLETSNMISHHNGKTYLEVHPTFVDQDGTAHEPEVGDPQVVPGKYEAAVVIYYKIADEGTPLPTAA